MRITTLIENLVYDRGLVAEHGLSLYLEAGGKRILFDTGQSGLFLHNASKLGIRIEDVDTLVLSHGHYDHTGGLSTFLQVNKSADIFVGAGLFEAKFGSKNGFIGTKLSDEEEAELKNRIRIVDKPICLNIGVSSSEVNVPIEELYIMPKADIFFPNDFHNKGLLLKTEEGFAEDMMEDEIYLVLKSASKQGDEGRIGIISACSHRGITNICQSAQNYFNTPLRFVIGGFHTISEPDESVNAIIGYMQNSSVEKVGVCHCSGIESYVKFVNSGIAVFYNSTGKITAI